MINIKNNVSPLLFAIALSLGVSACSSDLSGGDSAFLTIQNESNLFLEPGFQRDLSVKYHDAQGNPLAGEVTFEILGELRGSSISETLSAANIDGNAEFTLYAGQDETVFRIKASAAAAASVEWTVSVAEGSVAEDMDIRGTYSVESSFDVINGLPGNVGNVVNTFADWTDGPYDPATALIDSLDDSNTIAGFRPALDAILFDLLESNAPSIVLDIVQLGSEFGEITRNFGVISTMDISGDDLEGTNMKAVHTITAYKFELDDEEFIFTMDDLDVDDEVITDIDIDYDNTTGLAIFAEHTIPLRYGAFLVLALEEVIIPRLEPNARSLDQFFSARVNCTEIGQSIFEFTDVSSPNFWKSTCEVALQAVASIIIEQLRELDEVGQVKLIINGKARMRDPSGDGQADKMTRGDWSGTMDYLGSMGPLADGANPFSGDRININ